MEVHRWKSQPSRGPPAPRTTPTGLAVVGHSHGSSDGPAHRQPAHQPGTARHLAVLLLDIP
jgi:hypothetical protein